MNQLKFSTVFNMTADTEFQYFLKSSSGDIIPLDTSFKEEFLSTFTRKDLYEYITHFVIPTHFPDSKDTFSLYCVQHNDLLDPPKACSTGNALLEEIRRLVEAQ